MAGNSPLTENTLQKAQVLWEYMCLKEPLKKADVVIAMGSHDLRVAEYAARLVLDGWAPRLICSGGLGRLTSGMWAESEAARFSQIAKNIGLPDEHILLEDRSNNTGENLTFSRELCASLDLRVTSAILVHKPYMLRRVHATLGIAWPGLTAVLATPPIAFRDYPTKEIHMEDVIHILVGDFQRVRVYPEKGFALPQEIPADVLKAFHHLVREGYVHHLVGE